ncbi:PLP-dependent transferase [Parafannyhessea umbonata]|nr:PLP-dependent transferase [Parafannyhessea umbonata]MCI7218530.1 PLP-dependent transferase [Parafannyhessea umbonata]
MEQEQGRTDAARAGREGRGDLAEEALRDACRTFARALGGRSRAWVVAAPDVEDVARRLGIDPGAVVEPLGGAPVRMRDVRALARHRDEAPAAERVPLAVDVSLTSALGCPAGRLGADVTLASLDRIVCTPACGMVMVGLRREALQGRDGCAGMADVASVLPVPEVSQLQALAAGMADFDARRRCANDNAQVMAAYLRCHPAVRAVRYPGLTDDPSYEAAAANLEDGFGPAVDVLVDAAVAASAAGRGTNGAVDLCGRYVPGGTASRVQNMATAEDGAWLRVECGCGDARKLVAAAEALLRR